MLPKAQSRTSTVKEKALYINKDMQHHWGKFRTDNLSLSNLPQFDGLLCLKQGQEQVLSQNLLKMCTHKAFGSIPPL